MRPFRAPRAPGAVAPEQGKQAPARWKRGHILRNEAEAGRRPAVPQSPGPRSSGPSGGRSWSLWGFLNKCGYIIHHLNTHFLPYAFFLVTYYLLCIFILGYGKDVRPKANLSSFLIQVQNGLQSSRENSQHEQRAWPRSCWCRAGSGRSWWFGEGGESLSEECGGRPSEADNGRLRANVEADSPTTA